jgi:hypothetical protein
MRWIIAVHSADVFGGAFVISPRSWHCEHTSSYVFFAFLRSTDFGGGSTGSDPDHEPGSVVTPGVAITAVALSRATCA